MDAVPCQKDRMLVVDDDESVRKTFKRVIAVTIPSLMVDMATNGMEAIKIFRAEHHSVILMDLFMPIMNGEKAFREISNLCEKENWVMPSVVFCTGYNTSLEIKNIVKMSSKHAVLQKPVRNEVLVEAIRSRLNGPPDQPAPASPASRPL